MIKSNIILIFYFSKYMTVELDVYRQQAEIFVIFTHCGLSPLYFDKKFKLNYSRTTTVKKHSFAEAQKEEEITRAMLLTAEIFFSTLIYSNGLHIRKPFFLGQTEASCDVF